MYDIKDKYIEFPGTADHLYNKNTQLYKDLVKLSKQKWDLVLTHNENGEYKNTHHIAVHHMVKKNI